MSQKRFRKTPKAYQNSDFLNSPDARVLRILSEFLEPLRRFRRNRIRDTVVFFGSARIRSRKDALIELKKNQSIAKRTKVLTPLLRRKLERSKINLEMSRYYEDATQLAKMLATWSKNLMEKNRFIVCSGGGPGIMEAVNRGAYLAKAKSVGLNISLPFEQYPNPYITPGLDFDFHYFFMRKFWFVYLAKAFIMFPGGFGTLDELMEVLTLLQTDKIKKKVTVVLYGREYWESILNIDALVNYGVISEADLKLFTYKDTPKEAFDYLVKELKKNYSQETISM